MYHKFMGDYIQLSNLEVYKIARQLSDLAWTIYNKMNWETKKIIGQQFIESVDSVGANIAEGYSRYHYLDRIKFYYNSRGSLSEANEHWIELINSRYKIEVIAYKKFKELSQSLSLKLNNFINSTYKAKST